MEKDVLLQLYSREKYLKLTASIVVDIIGILTYFFPAIGEVADAGWAPVAAFANYLLFGGKAGVIGGAGTLIEEALPWTDFIPSVTMTWYYKYVQKHTDTFEEFVQRKNKDNSIIDDN